GGRRILLVAAPRASTVASAAASASAAGRERDGDGLGGDHAWEAGSHHAGTTHNLGGEVEGVHAGCLHHKFSRQWLDWGLRRLPCRVREYARELDERQRSYFWLVKALLSHGLGRVRLRNICNGSV